MNCEMARNQMLEADLSELGGEGDGALAQHLRACAQCRERARRILEQTAALKGALERLAPRVSPEGIQRGQPTPTTQLRRWAVTVPLALAAGLAVLLLSRPRGMPAPARSLASPAALAAAPLDVQVPPGRAVTVFQTDNPNIVVIWSF